MCGYGAGNVSGRRWRKRDMVVLRGFVSTLHSTSASASRKMRVLLGRAVGDAQRARAARARRRRARARRARAARASPPLRLDLRPARTSRSWPASRRGPGPARAAARPSRSRSAIVRVTRSSDRILVGERLDGGGLCERVAEERLAHLVERARQLLASRTARSRRAARTGRRPSRRCAAAPGWGGARAARREASGSSSRLNSQ